MRPSELKLRSAKKLLQIIDKRIELVQLNVLANAGERAERETDLASVRTAFQDIILTATADIAIAEMLKCRERMKTRTAQINREIECLDVQRQEILVELEVTIRQREALAGYLARRR